ncbi:MAG: hypothetical protein ABI402_10520 [Ferruginibacter sp.]
MKINLIIILCFLTVVTNAQNRADSSTKQKKYYLNYSPYNPHNPLASMSIKGIIIPYISLGSAGLNSSFGLEYGFLKRHSLGADLFYNMTEGHNDDVNDTLGNSHPDGDNGWTSNERGFFINYRYYLNYQKLLERTGSTFYLSCFFRHGESKTWYNPFFPNDYIYKHEVQNSVGILLGAIGKLDDRTQRYLDLDAGIFFKQKNADTRYEEMQTIKFRKNKSSNIGFRLGLKLGFWIRRKYHS